jgi:hypothetical protein
VYQHFQLQFHETASLQPVCSLASCMSHYGFLLHANSHMDTVNNHFNNRGSEPITSYICLDFITNDKANSRH